MTIPLADVNASLVDSAGVETAVHFVDLDQLLDYHRDLEAGRAPESDAWVAGGFGATQPENISLVAVIDGADRAAVQTALDALRQAAEGAASVEIYSPWRGSILLSRPIYALTRFYPESPVGAFGYRVRMVFSMDAPRGAGYLADSGGTTLADSGGDHLLALEVW